MASIDKGILGIPSHVPDLPVTLPVLPVLRAVVRFQVEGQHHWPQAPKERAYLRYMHRHLFHVEVTMTVGHQEREVEYHDLLDFCKESFGGGEMGPKSCETMALELLEKLCKKYPGRQYVVSIFEDGENGAVVSM